DKNASFPNTKERFGHYIGPAENCGDALTHKVYLEETGQVIKRSVLRSADHAGINLNARLDEHVKDLFEAPVTVDPTSARAALHVDPKDLVGYRFITDFWGDNYAAHVVENIDDVRFRVELGDGQREEIMLYNDLIGHVNNQITDDPDDADKVWMFDEILDHRPLQGKAHQWEVLVKWATGESS
ncbi:MAG: hypothetical protein ACRDL7_06840, partial [Gaiellaceae bacterium]